MRWPLARLRSMIMSPRTVVLRNTDSQVSQSGSSVGSAINGSIPYGAARLTKTPASARDPQVAQEVLLYPISAFLAQRPRPGRSYDRSAVHGTKSSRIRGAGPNLV